MNLGQTLDLVIPSLIAGVFVLIGVFVTRSDRRRVTRAQGDSKVLEVEAGAYARAQAIDDTVYARLAAEVERLERREDERDKDMQALQARVALLEKTLRAHDIELP